MARISAAQIRSYWLAAGGSDAPIRTNVGRTVPLSVLMTAIALAESNRGDTAAINPGFGVGGVRTNEYSVGLWQINTRVHRNYSVEQLKNPAINAREAVRIYRSQGLNAWHTTYYRLKSYAQFLDVAAGASVQLTASNLPASVGSFAGGGSSQTETYLLAAAAAVVLFLILE